jgi:hypothetical protein
MFNATFRTISVISWRSVLLVVFSMKTTDLPQVIDKTLSHTIVSSTPRDDRDSNSQVYW